MPKLSREDGVELHWEERGAGALVVLAPYLNVHPTAFEPLIAELEDDHRLVRYDARGYGESTRSGPHDADMGADDLCAVAEHGGGDAVVVALADSCGPAVRAATRHSELVRTVIAVGTLPVSLQAFRESESLVSSESVVDALLEQFGRDYRGALRSLLTATNRQMSEEEVRRRVDAQVAYTPQEAVVERLHTWAEDDPLEFGKELGDRLWLLIAPEVAGIWFPAGEEMKEVIRPLLSEAHQEEIADGIASRPELTAAIVRRAAASAAAGGRSGAT